MLNLTFGEQVKIVLSRKGMTIKELAEQIEERTGKKMSRQNLTQRLGRDNFQEQDMRMIAEILGCSFQLSILATVEAEKASVIEEVLPTDKELGKLAAKKEMKAAREERKKEESQDLTVGEYVDMNESVQLEETVVPEEAKEALVEEAPVEEAAEVEETANAAPELKKETVKYSEKSKYFQPIKKDNDADEDLELGDINPYTGHEYKTNSVRSHPSRIGYVQVYDRKDHKWTDMTEWAFLGYEERRKLSQGKDYIPPTYLD